MALFAQSNGIVRPDKCQYGPVKCVVMAQSNGIVRPHILLVSGSVKRLAGMTGRMWSTNDFVSQMVITTIALAKWLIVVCLYELTYEFSFSLVRNRLNVDRLFISITACFNLVQEYMLYFNSYKFFYLKKVFLDKILVVIDPNNLVPS